MSSNLQNSPPKFSPIRILWYTIAEYLFSYFILILIAEKNQHYRCTNKQVSWYSDNQYINYSINDTDVDTNIILFTIKLIVGALLFHTLNITHYPLFPKLWLLTYLSTYRKYRIVQNGGRGKFWRISNFKKLAGKTLANCNELFFSSCNALR